MKTERTYLAAVLLLLGSACQKEEVPPAMDELTTEAVVYERVTGPGSEEQFPGNDSINTGGPVAAGVAKSWVYFTPSGNNYMCPTKINGDREFDGHGPVTTASVQLYIASGGKKVIAHVYYRVKETVSDWSEAVMHRYYTIYVADPGRTIASIDSDTYVSYTFTDTNHSPRYQTISNNQAASVFIMNGDTNGNDIGNCTHDDAYLTVLWNTVALTVI